VGIVKELVEIWPNEVCDREVERQKEEDAMEGVEEGSGGHSPVAYSVRTGAR